ncbi:MAG TPA: hypothetical protein VLZ75_01840 [Chitinophagales bacterium]|nr:hypothetical protein [Chitinophagales bacterium]
MILLISSLSGFAQEKNVVETAPSKTSTSLKVYHDSLKVFNFQLINDSTETQRSAAAMKIIKVLSKALREQGSFNYKFDSLNSIAIMEPEDKKFRIFTWQLAFDNGTYRYFGVIQSNETQPQLQPLVDYTDFYDHIDSIIVDADRWIGALYYQIIPMKVGKTTYYTLFGWDGNNIRTNKKYIDVLWFDKEGKAKFGYPIFNMLKGKSPTRIVFEYKKDAALSISFYPEIKQIYYDHLVSLSGNTDASAIDLVPDGTLESFEWAKGKWKQINMVEYQRRENGDVPNVIKEQTKPLYQPLRPR